MTARRVLVSQKLPDLRCDDQAVAQFVNGELRAHVALTYESFRRLADAALLTADPQTFNGSNVFDKSSLQLEPSVAIESANPQLDLWNTSGAADEKRYNFHAGPTKFTFRALNDAGTVAGDVLVVERTGTTVDSIALAATAITLNGVNVTDYARLSQSNVFTGGVVQISAASPRFTMFESDAAANNGVWDWNASGEALTLRVANDGFNSFGNIMVVERTGTTVDSISLAATRIALDGVARLKGYTVATLPAGTIGDTAYVTDALAPVFGVAVAGGGAVMVPVYFTGGAWFVG